MIGEEEPVTADDAVGETRRAVAEPRPSPLIPRPSPLVPRPSVWRSFYYAFAGIGYCLRTQRNFRIHTLAAGMVLALGLLLGLAWTEWAILAVMVTLVMSAEMINTVVEAAVDLASPAYHPLAKVA